MSLVTKALHRYLNENQQSSEMYMTAQRTVKMGLTASAIVSAWTWVRSNLNFKSSDLGNRALFDPNAIM